MCLSTVHLVGGFSIGGPPHPGRPPVATAENSMQRREQHAGNSRQEQHGREQPAGNSTAENEHGRRHETVTTYKVGLIGGDGIGPEVVAEALKVVDAAGVSLSTTEYDLGADRYVRTGEILPDPVLEELRQHDAILLGAVGPPVGSGTVPPGALERGLLLRLRFELDLYVNMRPFTGVPGALAPDCDFVVIRENTEGTYAGEGGFLRTGNPLRGGHPGIGEHPPRRGAVCPVRLRVGIGTAPPPSDPGPQDQRAHLRRRSLAANGRRGVGRLPHRHPRLQPRGCHLHLPGRARRLATT